MRVCSHNSVLLSRKKKHMHESSNLIQFKEKKITDLSYVNGRNIWLSEFFSWPNSNRRHGLLNTYSHVVKNGKGDEKEGCWAGRIMDRAVHFSYEWNVMTRPVHFGSGPMIWNRHNRPRSMPIIMDAFRVLESLSTFLSVAFALRDSIFRRANSPFSSITAPYFPILVPFGSPKSTLPVTISGDTLPS